MKGFLKRLLDHFNGNKERDDETSTVLNRLKKQQKPEEMYYVEDLGLTVLSHNKQAILVSQIKSKDRCHWPQLKASSPMLSAGRGNGFWDRVINAQKDALRSHQPILDTVTLRYY